MLNKVKLTEAEMREFAEVFAYYDYGDEEIGMKHINTRTLGDRSCMYDLVRET
ncbi:MAG: hypothetical protein K6F86_07605 [Lachnospiraceae bacterium]|nr:hypothetical protein [Lachnospiraceae bacterium]